METIGMRELLQHASSALRRVKTGKQSASPTESAWWRCLVHLPLPRAPRHQLPLGEFNRRTDLSRHSLIRWRAIDPAPTCSMSCARIAKRRVISRQFRISQTRHERTRNNSFSRVIRATLRFLVVTIAPHRSGAHARAARCPRSRDAGRSSRHFSHDAERQYFLCRGVPRGDFVALT